MFLNAKLKYKLNLKCEPLLLELLLKFVLRRRKRSDSGVSYETLGIYMSNSKPGLQILWEQVLDSPKFWFVEVLLNRPASRYVKKKTSAECLQVIQMKL